MKAMIRGVGIDLASISRFKQIISKTIERRFVNRVLHPEEVKRYLEMSKETKPQYIASR